MDNKFNISHSNIGSVGDNNIVTNEHFELTNNNSDNIDFVVLADEISQLTTAFEKNNTTGEHNEIIKEMKVAGNAAKLKDIKTVRERLKPIQDNVLKIARAIGVEMLASWISKQAGL